MFIQDFQTYFIISIKKLITWKKDTDMETKDELHMDINTDNNVRLFTQVTGDLC